MILVLSFKLLNRQNQLCLLSYKKYLEDTLRENVQIRSFSGTHFPAFGLSTEIYGIDLLIHSKYGKIQTRKSPYLDTFHAMINFTIMNCGVNKITFISYFPQDSRCMAESWMFSSKIVELLRLVYNNSMLI